MHAGSKWESKCNKTSEWVGGWVACSRRLLSYEQLIGIFVTLPFSLITLIIISSLLRATTRDEGGEIR